MNARDHSQPLLSDQTSALAVFAGRTWDEEIVPALTRYVAIPAKSPMFDANWAGNGHIERVITDAAAWVEGKKLPGLKLEVVRLAGRTPVIFFRRDYRFKLRTCFRCDAVRAHETSTALAR